MLSQKLVRPSACTLSEPQALKALCRLLASSLPCDAVLVAAMRHPEAPLTFLATTGNERAPSWAVSLLTVSGGAIFQASCPLVLRREQSTESAPAVTLLAACIREEGGRPWGVLAVVRQGSGTFSEEECRELEQVAQLAGTVVAQSAVRAALAASEERFHSLLDTAGDIILCHDIEGRFLWTNRAATEITGYSQEELLGLRVDQLIAPECLELLHQRAQIRRGGHHGRSTAEYTFLAKDGRRIPVEVSTSALCRDGQVVAIHGIARDISERKRLEEQLRQSQKLDAIGRLAGGVAHDFNNILAVINGYASQLLGQADPAADPDGLRTALSEILTAGESAAELTQQLLAFSRKSLITPRPLHFAEVIQGMEGLLRRLIGEDLQLRITSEPDLWPVRADPGQLQQVILNLAINARDAMPRGGLLALSLRNYLHTPTNGTHPALQPGSYVLLLVRDTGEGMDSETLAHLFEPFFTTKPGGMGTGLGLATVYGIVQQSQGEIEVESAPGAGTLFRVYLPAVHIAAEEPIPKEAPPVPPPSRTVLLVEDEPMLRRLVRTVLTGAGYTVLDAGDPGEAVLQAARHPGPLDLLLTDVVMPGMGGRELAERLQKSRPTLRVLFMSGYTDDAVLRYGVSSAETAFIQKPFSPGDLLAQIATVLAAPAPTDTARPISPA